MTICHRNWLAYYTPILLFLAGCAQALSVNRTIDDQYGDSVTALMPRYSPPHAWNQGATCEGCHVQLDHSDVYNGTWHDSTYQHKQGAEPSSITMRFNGTAVYVYNALANTVPSTDTLTNLTFALDGHQVGTFMHERTSSMSFDYNIPVYTNESLQNMEHELKIVAVSVTAASLVLFDYAIYTFTDEDVSSEPSSNATGARPTQVRYFFSMLAVADFVCSASA